MPSKFRNGRNYIILPERWVRHRLVVIPFNQCFISEGYYSFDTVECLIYEASINEYKENRIYLSKKYEGMDCIVSYF